MKDGLQEGAPPDANKQSLPLPSGSWRKARFGLVDRCPDFVNAVSFQNATRHALAKGEQVKEGLT
ncbi:MAG: hypothetical protein RLO10_15430 [Roseovarius indicus]